MVLGYQALSEAARQYETDLRNAAFLIEIEKVAAAYQERAIFP